jgi:hypothetical protein
MHYFLRVLALVALVLVSIVDVSRISLLQNEEIQMILGTFIIFVLVLYDVVVGALLSLALFLAYFRLNKANFNIFDWALTNSYGDILETSSPYVTEQHLQSVQSNVVSDTDLDKEMIGIEGDVYGAQGMDKIMPGSSGVMRAAADY